MSEREARYEAEFKKPYIEHTNINPFRIKQCHFCDQRVVMKLIRDPLSNSSFWIYSGKCPNGHWNEAIPGTPDDVKVPPQCPICNSYMQYKTSEEFNGWLCVWSHEEKLCLVPLIDDLRLAEEGD